jgi:hypothetical protein
MIESDDKYARLAARLLLEERSESPSDRTDCRRDVVIAAMALAIAKKVQRRRIVIGTVSLLAMTAGLILTVRLIGGRGEQEPQAKDEYPLVVEHQIGYGNLLVRATSTQPLPELGILHEGDNVRSDRDSSATFGFSNGTRIALSSSGHLRVDELNRTRRFSLFQGRVQARVAKLAQGERFFVTTPDSEVEVRGTVFAVAVHEPPSRCGGAASSSTVEVSEGEVWVRSGGKQVMLHPGQTWFVPCAEEPSAQSASTESSQSAPTPHSITAGSSTRFPSHKNLPAKTAPSSTTDEAKAPTLPASYLALQNDLMTSAMKAERLGRHKEALRKLDQLLNRFPDGPLAETARTKRQRILSAQGRR